MKEMKRKDVIILLILAIIIVLIIGCLIFSFYKERLVKDKKIASLNDTASGMQDNNINENTNADTSLNTNTNTNINTTNANTSTNTSNKNSIIGETTSVEISVVVEIDQKLDISKPIKIYDKDAINYLVDELNNSEEFSDLNSYDPDDPYRDYDMVYKNPVGKPHITFNLKNGSSVYVAGCLYSTPQGYKYVFTLEELNGAYNPIDYQLKSSTDLESYIKELYEKNKENQVASSLNYSDENEINLILGSYTVQPDEKILGDEYITFLENNKFNAYKGFGICISGIYTISDNKIDCIADTCYGDYGPNQKISASISFKINSNSELEVIDTTESFKIKVVDMPTNSLTDETNDIFLSPFEKGIKFVLSK